MAEQKENETPINTLEGLIYDVKESIKNQEYIDLMKALAVLKKENDTFKTHKVFLNKQSIITFKKMMLHN